MKIVKPSYKHLKHDVTPLQFIERIGRICYKSEDKITEGSAEKFVQSLIKSGHMAMIEHETAYIQMNPFRVQSFLREIYEFEREPEFFNFSVDVNPNVVSGSLRAFYELCDYVINSKKISEYKKCSSTIMLVANIIMKEYPAIFSDEMKEKISSYARADLDLDLDLFMELNHIISRDAFIREYKTIPEIITHHLTHSVCFTCDRGVSHELVRHRKCSFAQESTRYCNYSKNKFGNEITVIEPYFYKDNPQRYEIWKKSCEDAEQAYFDLLSCGSSPQEARSVLPHSTKVDIVMTATEEEWQHIVNLRVKGITGKPHPQMIEVMTPWYEKLKEITEGRIC